MTIPVEIRTKKEYETLLADLIEKAYNFCKLEMCNVDDEIKHPNIMISKTIPRPKYAPKNETIIFPNYFKAEGLYDYHALAENTVHEMSHHFKKKLSEYKQSDNSEIKETIEQLTPKQFKKIYKTLERELNKGGKEKDRIMKWEEGVARRLEERYLF